MTSALPADVEREGTKQQFACTGKTERCTLRTRVNTVGVWVSPFAGMEPNGDVTTKKPRSARVGFVRTLNGFWQDLGCTLMGFETARVTRRQHLPQPKAQN